jgi:hypothetical protein
MKVILKKIFTIQKIAKHLYSLSDTDYVTGGNGSSASPREGTAYSRGDEITESRRNDMKIRTATEFIRLGRHSGESVETAPRYIRRGAGKGSAADRVELSAEAMARSREARNTPLVKAFQRISPGMGIPVWESEVREDANREARIADLIIRIRSGAYDFDSPEALAAAADSLMD